ncbi:MAG: FIG01363442: possible membrane protein [uncultured Nocardioidaceae bacterium]|uniref:FIG01363442: possible membrane protein n=1 Tax=uncultured Nocardioidaceae bacterium TaxID=253824 RepID=A0A6J4M415_9ACTN|nr:MAG: FIG01363442: possible membrane protein [uncultured Nocardioidaceae bacterium]
MHGVEVRTAGWVRAEAEVETVEVRLGYDPADPFAVRVDISGPARQSTWVFGRDLLADGLRSMTPIGDGCVRVQATSVLTEISHVAESGDTVLLRLPWWNTREFVRLSQAQVPRGHESCDVDAWVAALTSPREP